MNIKFLFLILFLNALFQFQSYAKEDESPPYQLLDKFYQYSSELVEQIIEGLDRESQLNLGLTSKHSVAQYALKLFNDFREKRDHDKILPQLLTNHNTPWMAAFLETPVIKERFWKCHPSSCNDWSGMRRRVHMLNLMLNLTKKNRRPFQRHIETIFKEIEEYQYARCPFRKASARTLTKTLQFLSQKQPHKLKFPKKRNELLQVSLLSGDVDFNNIGCLKFLLESIDSSDMAQLNPTFNKGGSTLLSGPHELKILNIICAKLLGRDDVTEKNIEDFKKIIEERALLHYAASTGNVETLEKVYQVFSLLRPHNTPQLSPEEINPAHKNSVHIHSNYKPTTYGETPLHKAAQLGQSGTFLKIFRNIHSNDPKVFNPKDMYDGTTPLDHALANQSIPYLRAVKNPAIDVIDKDISAYREEANAIIAKAILDRLPPKKILAMNGPNKDFGERKKLTLLEKAALGGNLETVKILTEKLLEITGRKTIRGFIVNAGPSLAHSSGRTFHQTTWIRDVFDAAKKSRNPKVLEYLQSKMHYSEE